MKFGAPARSSRDADIASGQRVRSDDDISVYESDYVATRELRASVTRVCWPRGAPAQSDDGVRVARCHGDGRVGTHVVYDDDLVRVSWQLAGANGSEYSVEIESGVAYGNNYGQSKSAGHRSETLDGCQHLELASQRREHGAAQQSYDVGRRATDGELTKSLRTRSRGSEEDLYVTDPARQGREACRLPGASHNDVYQLMILSQRQTIRDDLRRHDMVVRQHEDERLARSPARTV